MNPFEKLICHPVTIRLEGGKYVKGGFPTTATRALNYSTVKDEENFAVMCGEINDIIVVDLDFPKEEKTEATWDDTLDLLNFKTLTTKTCNKGYHLYFQYDEQLAKHSNFRNATGGKYSIDILANKCIAIQGKHYEISEDLPIAKVDDKLLEWFSIRTPIKLKAKVPKEQKKLTKKELKELDNIISMLSAERAHDYNTWIAVGFALHNYTSGSKEGFELFDYFSHESTKYVSEDELQQKWDAMMERDDGFNIEALKKWAQHDSPELYESSKNRLSKIKTDSIIDPADFIEFEKTNCFIKDLTLYFSEGVLKTESQMHTTFRNMSNIGESKKSFIKAWFDSPTKRTYKRIECYPNVEKCPTDVYNSWVPFSLADGVDFEFSQDAVDLFKQQLFLLSDEQDDVAKWSWNHFAHILQCPEKKEGVAIVWSGTEGIGKGLFVSLLEKIYGKTKMLITSNVSNNVLSKFNGQLSNAFIVNINEMTYEQMRDGEEDLKALITDDRVIIQRKGQDQFEERNYSRIIITTNNFNSIKITSTDRRYLISNCSKTMLGKTKYFDSLAELANNDAGIRSIFKALMETDLTGCVFNKFPSTAIREEHMEVGIPPLQRWLIDFIEDRKEESIELSMKDITISYNIWAIKEHEEEKISNRLGVDFESLKLGIKKKKKVDGAYRTFNILDLKQRLGLIEEVD